MGFSLAIDDVFSPHAPITRGEFCYGRRKEVSQIIQSVQAPGKHIILFGERGSGKTSLANIVYQKIDQVLKIRIICSQLLNSPDKIWVEISEKLLIEIESNPQFKPFSSLSDSIKSVLEKKKFKFNDLVYLFSLIKASILILVDEADLLTSSKENMIAFAEFIKAFSDQLPNVTLMMIGIASHANELIAKHISLERCLIEIKLSRMNVLELKDILEGGLIKLNYKMMEDVKNHIVHFSEGLPFYIHLLAKEALEHAQKLKYKTVVNSNFQFALKKIIEDRIYSLEYSYQKAVHYSKNGFYEKVLDACIDFCETIDPSEQIKFFRVKDIIPFFLKKQNSCHERTIQNYLSKICEPSKGEILSKTKNPTGTGIRFAFRNPLMKIFIRDKIST